MTMDHDYRQFTHHFGLDTDPYIICPCCDVGNLSRLFWDHMSRLEYLRVKCDFPITINSGHRCKKHNTKVGGAEKSMHLKFATDIRPSDGDPEKLGLMWAYARDLGYSGIGRYWSFIHLDLRGSPYTWDNRTTKAVKR